MSRAITLKAVNQAGQFPPLYLNLEGEHLQPTILGTGRSAVVLLATTTDTPENPANEYRAVKFLRDDPDKQYAAAAAERFFLEAGQAQKFDHIQEAFVKYYGWGALGSAEDGRSWWRNQFARYSAELANVDEELQRLRSHFDLQGPFYVLRLCQGTLHDLLDKDQTWHELPAYGVRRYHTAIIKESERIAEDIREVTERYLTRSPAGLSGYEILNSFRTDTHTPNGKLADRIRSFAVLELFAEVADSVSNLHSQQSELGPLAHRDLKPGNIFFEHEASSGGFNDVSIKLADLGYVTTPARIAKGEQTLREGRKGAEYLAPGSQFFRAPEQATLPIEVRVDIDPGDPSVVRIKGSKLSKIEVHDWLMLSDLFGEKEDDGSSGTELFKILKVDYNQADNTFRLELDSAVVTSKPGDLQGEITRATGFHTDGFSLGAILYDMISGGRDPELFYTYCLASYTSQFARGATYGVDDVLEILAPRQSGDGPRADSERLTLAEKGRATQQILASQDLDSLLSNIQNAVLLQRNSADSQASMRLDEKLKHFRFRNFELVRELLTDRRGVPIPRDILEIIVRCMVRDAPDSYYRRDPVHGFLTAENYTAATRIFNDVRALLGREEYQLPREGFPRSLQANLLFKLRSLTPRSVA